MRNSLVLLSLCLLVGQFSYAHRDGQSSAAKVAELAVHRIDRLVALNKIDASFLKNTVKVEIAEVASQTPVAYTALVSQAMPAKGERLSVTMSFDKDAKPLAFQVLPGGVAGPDSNWPELDSVTLIENALHYILDNVKDAKVAVFYEEMGSLELSKAVLNGQNVALAQIWTMDGADQLKIYLKLDGTLISTETLRIVK